MILHSGINRGMFLRQLNNDADPANSFNSNYGFFTCIRTCKIIELAIVYVRVREKESHYTDCKVKCLKLETGF